MNGPRARIVLILAALLFGMGCERQASTEGRPQDEAEPTSSAARPQEIWSIDFEDVIPEAGLGGLFDFKLTGKGSPQAPRDHWSGQQ